jgi:hypothetical protein
MGLARELSMGPRRKRTRIGNEGDYATLRQLTAAKQPDLVKFREVLDRVAASPARKRYAEGLVWTAACTRYSALTGEQYGPQQGTY